MGRSVENRRPAHTPWQRSGRSIVLKTMKCKRWMLMMLVLLGWMFALDAQGYYNPSTGRWLNRDPIGESGLRNELNARQGKDRSELNLYAFVENSSIAKWDYLGLDNPGCDLPDKYKKNTDNSDCSLRCCAQ